MIGGPAFVVRGHMSCGVTGDALVVRIGPEGKDRALAWPHVRPMQLAGRSLAGFVCVEPGGYATCAALQEWIERAIAFVSTLSAGKPPSSHRSETPFE